MNKCVLHQKWKVGLMSEKSASVLYHTNRISSQDMQKLFDKNQCAFTILF